MRDSASDWGWLGAKIASSLAAGSISVKETSDIRKLSEG
jgi:hypothetical protein